MSVVEISRAKSRISWKSIRRLAKRVVPLTLAVVFIPKILAVYVVCGLVDVLRNRQPDWPMLERYFFGNGFLTWMLSPFNLLMDLLSLPYWNKGIYQLQDLPEAYQVEIKSLIDASAENRLVERLASHVETQDRAMVFFKWYGKNLQTSLNVPAFHKKYKYVRTIGVSVFNKKKSTSEHFGPLRVTLRVLYNINPIESRDAYIQVGDHAQRWCDNKLFIFDDTLQHKSFNETNEVRYCLFIDVLRPSRFPRLMGAILMGLRVILLRVNFLFYRNWDFIK